jgi:hypothetical protein
MLQQQALKSPPPQVTVRFDDGAHSFVLPEGATLMELADRLEDFGTRHDGAPISIEVAFNLPSAGSAHSAPTPRPHAH